MFTLKKLKIKGFRAYMGEKEFTFDNSAILLFGENHKKVGPVQTLVSQEVSRERS